MRDARPAALLEDRRDGQELAPAQLLGHLVERLAERDRHDRAQADEGVVAVPPQVLLERAPVALDPIQLAVVLGQEEASAAPPVSSSRFMSSGSSDASE